MGIQFQTIRHLTSPFTKHLAHTNSVASMERPIGMITNAGPGKTIKSNPDQSYSAANNGDNNAFGEAKLRMLIAFHLIAARLSRIRPSLSRTYVAANVSDGFRLPAVYHRQMDGQTLAAWVQAVGSILAIVAAFLISYLQYRSTLKVLRRSVAT